MIKPPGTILQHMYFKARLRRLRPGFFVEVGFGRGELSNILLEHGWSGIGFDLNPESHTRSRSINSKFIETGRFETRQADWLEVEAGPKKADMIISCMVLEHLDERNEARYFEKCKRELSSDGLMVLLVPAGEQYWGIEDEIAGHYRRYTRDTLKTKLQTSGFEVCHTAGLTFPVSNLLFPLSELLVKRAEEKKMAMTMQQRTVSSGVRTVPYKTSFPWLLGLVLNELVMHPFYWLQNLSRKSTRAMVLYIEGRPQK
jgi:SAM-dependent methyltransferase